MFTSIPDDESLMVKAESKKYLFNVSLTHQFVADNIPSFKGSLTRAQTSQIKETWHKIYLHLYQLNYNATALLHRHLLHVI